MRWVVKKHGVENGEHINGTETCLFWAQDNARDDNLGMKLCKRRVDSF